MTATIKLYEATDALQTVREWIEEHQDDILAAGGELPPELVELMDQADGDFNEKVERVGLFIRELERSADAATTESKRLGFRSTTLKNSADGLRGYLQRQLQRAGRDKVVGVLCTVREQRNSTPTIVAVPDVYLLPEEFVEQPPLPPAVPNRKALLNAFAEGKVLPAGVTIEVRKHLRIH